jgi:AcrR family transcriptional regulator
VARVAGVSKGGLLYHFPSKETLITELVADRLAHFDAAIVEAAATERGPVRGRWLRAYVRLTFAPPQPGGDLTAALFAAAATNPALLTPVWAAFDRWQAAAIADGLDPAAATLVRLAADGLWFADLFGAAAVTTPLRDTVRDALIGLIGTADLGLVLGTKSSGGDAADAIGMGDNGVAIEAGPGAGEG